MDSEFHTFFAAPVVGILATLFMDLWALFQSRILKLPVANFAMVGRWIGGMARGRFVHDNIGRASPVQGETALGWMFHYLTGVAYAVLLIAITGPDWLMEPTIMPAISVGLGTLAAPFLIMQPAFGFGIAASRTPKPGRARMLSGMAHGAFAIGLYLGGWLWSALTGAIG